MRKTWLRGCENVQKRHLLHIAGFNLDLLRRHLTGYGTPKGGPMPGISSFLAWAWETAGYGSSWRAIGTGRTDGFAAINTRVG